jgi:hypothetical protein
MKNLNGAVSDVELEDMEDSMSAMLNKVIELLDRKEIRSNGDVNGTLVRMYEKLSEANEAFGVFEYKLEKENER